jgi:hypothetical protein
VIEKKIEVCIGTSRAKDVRARLSLMVVDADQVLSEQYHSVAIMPGDDTSVIREIIEKHIGDPNGGVPGAPWPKIPDESWAEVEAHCAIVHKPAVVEAYKAQIAAAEASRVTEAEKVASAQVSVS